RVAPPSTGLGELPTTVSGSNSVKALSVEKFHSSMMTAEACPVTPTSSVRARAPPPASFVHLSISCLLTVSASLSPRRASGGHTPNDPALPKAPQSACQANFSQRFNKLVATEQPTAAKSHEPVKRCKDSRRPIG